VSGAVVRHWRSGAGSTVVVALCASRGGGREKSVSGAVVRHLRSGAASNSA
jgi:hypothetical protein